MTRYVLALVLLASMFVSDVRAGETPQEPETIEEVVFSWIDAGSRSSAHEPPAMPWLPEVPDAAAEALLRRIRQARFRVHVVAYAFERLPAALESPFDGTSATLRPDRAADVVTAVRDGDLLPLYAASASGTIGTELLGRELEQSSAVLRRRIESAIGAAVSYPRAEHLRSGLRFRAHLALLPKRGVTLRYQVALAEAPTIDTQPSLGGAIDWVSVPGLLAEGTVCLEPNETAAILRVAADGSGRLLLLSVAGRRPDVETLTDLGEGHVAALAGHLPASDAQPTAWMMGVPGVGGERADEVSVPDAWDELGIVPGIDQLEMRGGPLGLRIGEIAPERRGKLEALLVRSARERGARCRVDVSRPGWGRLSMPVSPGTGYRFFAGSVGTTRGDTEVESGCHHCVVAGPRTAWSVRGLKGAGWACRDGSTDVTLVGREILDVEQRTLALRRIRKGYGSFGRDPFTAPLIRQRILACRAALPRGHDRLPGGVRLRYVERLPPPAPGGTDGPPAPVLLEVGGEACPVRPGVDSWCQVTTLHPFIRRWESEGWCGMRARYPVVDHAGHVQTGIYEGTSLTLYALHVDGELRLDVSGEVRGAPEVLDTFAPGDGAVRIVRSPRLRLDLRDLPLGRGGRVAHGAGLDLVITRDGAEEASSPATLRIEAVARHPGAAGFVTGQGAGGLLDAGADCLVPSAFESYVSNHGTGHVTTAFRQRKDGIVLRVAPKLDHARVDVRLRSRLRLEPVSLEVDVEPDRPQWQRTLLLPRQRTSARILYLDWQDRLRYRSPDPSWPLKVSADVVSAGGER